MIICVYFKGGNSRKCYYFHIIVGAESGKGSDLGDLLGYIKAFTEKYRSFFGDSQILKIPKCFFVDLPENMFTEI